MGSTQNSRKEIGVINTMSVEIKGQYEGNLRVKLTHSPSGSTIETDAPKDNEGKGENFSPTDLIAAALGSCILTIMGIVAKRDGMDISGAYFRAEKHMADNPRRVDKIVIETFLPQYLNSAQRQKLEKTAHTCPVHQSIHPNITKEIKFTYASNLRVKDEPQSHSCRCNPS